jgi:mRNA interferase YafQ
MLKLGYKNVFLKDRKLAEKRGKDLRKLAEVMILLAEGKGVNPRYRDHQLSGEYKGRRECHIENNWLLIYKIDGDVIIFERTGTHADLFR